MRHRSSDSGKRAERDRGVCRRTRCAEQHMQELAAKADAGDAHADREDRDRHAPQPRQRDGSGCRSGNCRRDGHRAILPAMRPLRR